MSGDAKQPIIIKKIIKKGGHGHHGGAWKVAYADFVTAMMALFIVLWLLTQADAKSRAEIAQYFRTPGVVTGGALIGTKKGEAVDKTKIMDGGPDIAPNSVDSAKVQTEQRELEMQAAAINDTISKLAKENPELAELKNEVQVAVTSEGLVIQVVDRGKDMLFDLSSSALKPALVKALKRIALLLNKLPNPVVVGGHTDARPFAHGSTASNWDLSYQRADAARGVLESMGLSKGKIVQLQAYGDTDLLNPKDPFAPENRRLSILAKRRWPQKH